MTREIFILLKQQFIPNRDFFESYSEPLLITKEDDTPVFVNHAFTSLTGFDLISFTNAFPDSVAGFLGKENRGSTGEIALNIDNNSPVYVKVSQSKIIFSDKSKGYVYTIFDVTSFHQLMKKVAETEVRINNEMDDLIYVISHDMQGPLRTVVSYIQLIEKTLEKGNTENVKEFMKFAKEGVEKMNSMFDALLQFSRLTRKVNPFGEADLNDVVKSAIKNLSNQIANVDAKIIYNELPDIKADKIQLEVLFRNLIDNAIKFKSPVRKPEIRIAVEERSDDYLFSLGDNGIGIDSKFFNRIFVILQRLNSNPEYGGTGIGLAVCKKIVERYGGSIWVESKTGEGSTFYFTLKK